MSEKVKKGNDPVVKATNNKPRNLVLFTVLNNQRYEVNAKFVKI